MLVEELTCKTLTMRRWKIVGNACDVETLYSKFPFLQDPHQASSLTAVKCDTQFTLYFHAAFERAGVVHWCQCRGSN